MSSIIKPRKTTPVAPGKSKPKKPVNRARAIMNQQKRIDDRMAREQEEAAAAAAATAKSAAAAVAAAASTSSSGTIRRPQLQCPNKNCPNPNVVDGSCTGCGRVVEEMNIVAEVQFGETSTGAAVVQGSFVGADQGGLRPTTGSGPFRRALGPAPGESRERRLRDGREKLRQLARALRVNERHVDSAHRNFKLAVHANFIQGRVLEHVVGICLYGAIRKEPDCRVMLIDISEYYREDVFRLGRLFKQFLDRFPDEKEVTQPIIPENLIYRLASKLELFHDAQAVALSAIRIAKRMELDNMTHGRRPAPICGAAVLMAARAHGYRRCSREVAMMAKTTVFTIQNRLEEFTQTDSAQRTIDQFNNEAPLQKTHDPPAFARLQKELPPRPKRGLPDLTEDGREPEEVDEPAQVQPDGHSQKRQRLDSDAGDPHNRDLVGSEEAIGHHPDAHFQSAAGATLSPAASPPPEPAQPATRTDADGFVIPPLPNRAGIGATEKNAHSARNEDISDAALAYASGIDSSSEAAMALAQGIELMAPRRAGGPVQPPATRSQASAPTKRKRSGKKLPINQAWEDEEGAIEHEMEDLIADPKVVQATDEERNRLENDAAAGAQDDEPAEETDTPDVAASVSRTLDDPVIYDDEFADDEEVQNCLCDEETIKIKEAIWMNINKPYLREQQQKMFDKKRAERGPPKQRRNRRKKAQIGLGQASPASDAGEAAVEALKRHRFSTRINADAMRDVLASQDFKRGPSSVWGASTAGSGSNVTSREGSVFADATEGDDDDDDDNDGELGADDQSPAPEEDRVAAAVSEISAQALGRQLVADEAEEDEEDQEEGDGDEDDGDERYDEEDEGDERHGYEEEDDGEDFDDVDGYNPFAARNNRSYPEEEDDYQ